MKRKLADFGNLSAAEAAVVDRLGTGGDDEYGNVIINHKRPLADAGPDDCIRGEFIRYLMLYHDDTPETGVQVWGARITGLVNLEGGQSPRDLGLTHCHIDHPPVLRSAHLGNVNFSDSHLPGLNADRLETKGDVFLSHTTSQGEIRLLGANLGGDLDCTNAKLTAGKSGWALNADGLEAKGGVFLSDTIAQGEIRLPGAKLGAHLACINANLTAGKSGKALNADGLEVKGTVFLSDTTSQGEIRLLGANLGGDLDCTNAKLTAGESGDALSADRLGVKGTFFLRGGEKITGGLDLTDADIGGICDTRTCWPDRGNLVLDRCRYGAFVGENINAQDRIEWLNLQTPERFGQPFWPQPWEQCAKILREMGHANDARLVLIDKEKHQRAQNLKDMRDNGHNAQADVLAMLYWLLGSTIRYGHQPLYAFVWLGWFFIAGTLVFNTAAQNHAIKPNNAFVLRSAEWVGCLGAEPSQLDCYQNQPAAQSYPQFNAFVYSIDTLPPIVDLEMQGFWIPDDSAESPWGKWGRVYLWLHIAAGWGLSLLAVAGFSGLIKGRDA